MAPPSQKYRRIGFHLSGGSGGDVQQFLTIRPQELTYLQPSRLTVRQTLAGARADAFDRGIATVTLNGHTGWRGGFLSSGEDEFRALQAVVFDGWHDRRQEAIDLGTDPGEVELVFTDDLDKIDLLVAPQSFTLRRSKQSPLLMNYSIPLTVLGPAFSAKSILDTIADALNNPLRWLASVTGLGNTLGFLQGALGEVSDAYNAAMGIGAAVRGFLGTGISLLQSVQSLGSSLQGAFDGPASGLLFTALQFTSAASNAFLALGPPGGLSPADLIPAARLPTTFFDAHCSMANGFSSSSEVTIYDAMLGASTCSSTGGGDPASAFTVAGQNPFDSLYPSTTALVAVSPGASQAMTLLQGDPLLIAGQTGQVAQAMQTISSGVQVAT